MLSARAMLAVIAAGVVLSACGEAAGATSANDPVSVVTGYMKAAAGRQQSAAQAFLQKDISDGIPLKEPTPASSYVAQHKGAKWQVVAGSLGGRPRPPPQTNDACRGAPAAPRPPPPPHHRRRRRGAPPPGGGAQLCLVTVEVDSGSSKVWFHSD